LEPVTFNDLAYNPIYCIQQYNEIKDDITLEYCRRNDATLKSIPRLAWKMFHNRCLEKAVAIGGLVKAFVSKAIHGGRILYKRGAYQDVTLLDTNSLHSAALRELVIPIGAPEIITSDTDLDNVCYYVAKINVASISRSRSFMPFAQLGECILDKYSIEDLVTYCGAEYEVITGYCWKDGSVDHLQFIDELFAKKAEGGVDRDLYKKILNSLCGYTMRRGYETNKTKQFKTEDEYEHYIARNHSRIVKSDSKKRECTISKGVDDRFNYCHLGVAILSMAKRIMNRLLDECDSLGIDVYLSNTDSALIPTSRVNDLSHLIGTNLGQLHIETRSNDAIIINGTQYYLHDQHFRSAGIKHSTIEETGDVRGWYEARLKN
jgi:hypothetical protein